jgi:hypothetical protein
LRLQFELRQSLLGNDRPHRINDPQHAYPRLPSTGRGGVIAVGNLKPLDLQAETEAHVVEADPPVVMRRMRVVPRVGADSEVLTVPWPYGSSLAWKPELKSCNSNGQVKA